MSRYNQGRYDDRPPAGQGYHYNSTSFDASREQHMSRYDAALPPQQQNAYPPSSRDPFNHSNNNSFAYHESTTYDSLTDDLADDKQQLHPGLAATPLHGVPYSDGRDFREPASKDPFEYSGRYHERSNAPRPSSKRKWWLIALLVLVVVGGIVGGIVAWRVTASKSGNSSSGSGSSGSLQVIPGTAGVVKSNPNDPSQFEKDSRLKQSFWGMCYTPDFAQEQYGCGTTLANVTEDIQLLSQLTTRLRMYGSACNQSALVLQAIADTKVNMTVWLGIYIGDNETVNEQQMSETLSVLQTYGTDHVSGISVGNEYILSAYNQNPTTSVQTTAQTYLLSKVAQFKQRLSSLSLAKTLPVGTGDAGSMATVTLGEGLDYFMANVHAFFGGLPINQAAGWVWDYFEQNDVVVMAQASNKPAVFIAETGWPTQSMTAENATDGAAVAGVPQLQTFLNTYICAANTNQTQYFFFEAFDEPWKATFGGVEPYWGLFDSNKQLKSVTIPSC